LKRFWILEIAQQSCLHFIWSDSGPETSSNDRVQNSPSSCILSMLDVAESLVSTTSGQPILHAFSSGCSRALGTFTLFGV
jgi:hypothetical protein